MTDEEHEAANAGAKAYAEELARDGWDEWAPPVGSAGFFRGYKEACAAGEKALVLALKLVNSHLDRVDEERARSKDLAMICRRLAAASTLEARDRIARECHNLFRGEITRDG